MLLIFDRYIEGAGKDDIDKGGFFYGGDKIFEENGTLGNENELEIFISPIDLPSDIRTCTPTHHHAVRSGLCVRI